MGDRTQPLRHQRRKQTRPNTGLKHTAAAPAESAKACPDRADNELRRKVCILGAAGERGVVEIVDSALQILPDRLPTLAKIRLARPPEHEVGKFGRAESRETNELRLLLGGRRPRISVDGRGKANGRDVVAGAVLPALRQGAVAGEMKVRSAFTARGCRRAANRRDGSSRGRDCRRVGIVGVRARRAVGEGGHAEAETGRQCGAAEQIESEGIILRHWNLLVMKARAIAPPLVRGGMRDVPGWTGQALMGSQSRKVRTSSWCL